jgi:hypothetical protein
MQRQGVWSFSEAQTVCRRLPASIIFLSGLCLALAVLAAPFLTYQIVRITTAASIDYNEGWNVFHASLLAQHGILHRPFDQMPVVPVDYPPLSFFVVIAVSRLTGSLLLAGRVVALFSFVAIGVLLFETVRVLTRSKPAGLLAAVFWLSLISRLFGGYVGMNDPEMLGHLFTFAALYLFCRWHGDFHTFRIFIVALLCVLGIFSKHSIVAIPVALAMALLFSTPRDFLRFALNGVGLGALLLLSAVVWNGESAITNLIELAPPASTALLAATYKQLFLHQALWIVVLPVAALWPFKRTGPLIPIYVLSSLAFGSLAMRGIGCGPNHLFDFFIAIALSLGLCAANFVQTSTITPDGRDHATPWRRLLIVLSASAVAGALLANEFTLARFVSSDGVLEPPTVATIRVLQVLALHAGIGIALFFRRLVTGFKSYPVARVVAPALLAVVLAAGLIPMTQQYARDLNELDYQALASAEQRYLADVQRLRSIPGPALFEEALIGFDAGKDFLFDAYLGATLMSKGRLSEDVLIRPIREQAFSAIVLTFEIPGGFEKWPRAGGLPKRTVTERWTDNVLRAMSEHYEPVFQESRGFYIFYRPRKLEQRS